MLRNWFFQNYQKIFYVLDIMRDIVHLATRPDFSCFSQKLMVNPADATGLKEAFLKLKTLGLSADKGILQQIYLNVPDAMQIVSSYYLLKAANLENNQAFRNIIGKNTADATHVIGDAIQKYKENYWPSFFKKTAAVTVVAGAAWMLTRHLTK
jgi:hypothetical protein